MQLPLKDSRCGLFVPFHFTEEMKTLIVKSVKSSSSRLSARQSNQAEGLSLPNTGTLHWGSTFWWWRVQEPWCHHLVLPVSQQGEEGHRLEVASHYNYPLLKDRRHPLSSVESPALITFLWAPPFKAPSKVTPLPWRLSASTGAFEEHITKP